MPFFAEVAQVVGGGQVAEAAHEIAAGLLGLGFQALDVPEEHPLRVGRPRVSTADRRQERVRRVRTIDHRAFGDLEPLGDLGRVRRDDVVAARDLLDQRSSRTRPSSRRRASFSTSGKSQMSTTTSPPTSRIRSAYCRAAGCGGIRRRIRCWQEPQMTPSADISRAARPACAAGLCGRWRDRPGRPDGLWSGR